MAGSLLRAAGLPELITASLEDYEALALKLSRNRELLEELKARLGRNRTRCPLFDTGRFARHIEAAYAHICERVWRGEPPASFAVDVMEGAWRRT